MSPGRRQPCNFQQWRVESSDRSTHPDNCNRLSMTIIMFPLEDVFLDPLVNFEEALRDKHSLTGQLGTSRSISMGG